LSASCFSATPRLFAYSCMRTPIWKPKTMMQTRRGRVGRDGRHIGRDGRLTGRHRQRVGKDGQQTGRDGRRVGRSDREGATGKRVCLARQGVAARMLATWAGRTAGKEMSSVRVRGLTPVLWATIRHRSSSAPRFRSSAQNCRRRCRCSCTLLCRSLVWVASPPRLRAVCHHCLEAGRPGRWWRGR